MEHGCPPPKKMRSEQTIHEPIVSELSTSVVSIL
jgi:hypothetical protein